MTKLEMFEKETGLELVKTTTVWNYHGIDSLFSVATRKGSNLHAAISKMKKEGYKGGFTLKIGCIGRSAHSATEVGIFKGLVDPETSSCHYTKGHDEFFLNVEGEDDSFWC